MDKYKKVLDLLNEREKLEWTGKYRKINNIEIEIEYNTCAVQKICVTNEIAISKILQEVENYKTTLEQRINEIIKENNQNGIINN